MGFPPNRARLASIAGVSVLEMLVTMGLLSFLALTSMMLVATAMRATMGTRDAEVGSQQMDLVRTDLGANCNARLGAQANPAAAGGTAAVVLTGFLGGADLAPTSTLGDDLNLTVVGIQLEDIGAVGTTDRLYELVFEFRKRSADTGLAATGGNIFRSLYIRSPNALNTTVGACQVVGFDPTNYAKLQTALPTCQPGRFIASNAAGSPVCCFPRTPTDGSAQCQ